LIHVKAVNAARWAKSEVLVWPALRTPEPAERGSPDFPWKVAALA
jgi:hypothetical protein